jgi:hypothetical protein
MNPFDRFLLYDFEDVLIAYEVLTNSLSLKRFKDLPRIKF